MKSHIHRPARPADRAPVHVPPRGPVAAPARTAATGAGHDFGRVAVSRAPAAASAGPIQCLLSAEEFTNASQQHGIDKHDRRLARVQRHLAAYHATADEGTPQQRIAALNKVHRSAYRWFDATKSGTGLTNPDATPNTALMQRLLGEADDEHVDRTKDVVNDPKALPFDTSGMRPNEVKAAHQTWRSVVGGQGNLQIRGGAPFRDHTLSQVAKLMQHPTGRKLVGDVNEHFKYRRWRNKTVTIGDDFSQERDFQGEDVPHGSLAVATDTPSSRIVRGQPGKTDRALHATWLRGSPTLATGATLAGNIEKSITGGSDYGFQVGNESHRYNWGSSVLLRMAPHTGENDDTMLDRHENQVINPDFVTLGHELGHARRMQRGASLDKMGNVDSTLADMGAQGVQGVDAEAMWSNPEEFVNISHTENPIRAEHGISARAFHKGYRTVTATRRIGALRTDVNTRMGDVREKLKDVTHPELKKHTEELRDDSEDAQDQLTERGTGNARLLTDPNHLDGVANKADDVERRLKALIQRHAELTGGSSSSSSSHVGQEATQ